MTQKDIVDRLEALAAVRDPKVPNRVLDRVRLVLHLLDPYLSPSSITQVHGGLLLTFPGSRLVVGGSLELTTYPPLESMSTQNEQRAVAFILEHAHVSV